MALSSFLLHAAIQLPSVARDTIFVQAPGSQRSVLDVILSIASVVTAVAIMVFSVVAVPAAWHFRKMYRSVHHLVERVYGDVTPIVHHARSIADNVNYVTASIRSDVEMVNSAIHGANERVQEAVKVTEDRLAEFNALLAVVQEEAEQLFVSTASTVRGMRSGAAAYRASSARGGMDFASEELDPAEVADALESHLETFEGSASSAREEEIDGDDGSPGATTEAFPAAPRVRPRARPDRGGRAR